MQRFVDSRPAYPPEFDWDAPENCVECCKPLNIETQEYFCSGACERTHVAAQRAADDAYAEALAEEDRIAAEWNKVQAQWEAEGYHGY